jgi:hypothetical protein
MIGIVVPAAKILEVLNQPILLEREKEGLEQLRKNNRPVMDGGLTEV